MNKQAIVTSDAPSAIGTYSQGIVSGDTIYSAMVSYREVV